MIAHYSLHIPICVFYKYETLKPEEHEDYFDEHNGILRCSCPSTERTVSLEPSTSPTHSVDSDLLLLVSQRSKETINQLYNQGYNKLVTPKEDLFNQYIVKESQVEILKFIWTGIDLEKQDKTMRGLAEKNLAIFALEYSLFHQMTHENKTHRTTKSKQLSQQNYLYWNRKGLLLARLDICCLKDDRDLTNFVINILYKLPTQFEKTLSKRICNFATTLDLEGLPSPLWAKNIRNGDEFFPKDQWSDLRQKELSHILQNEKTLLW
ncbi:MAG: hypothetical protein ChlgKO_14640 [Chlamydiales bacterium]